MNIGADIVDLGLDTAEIAVIVTGVVAILGIVLSVLETGPFIIELMCAASVPLKPKACCCDAGG